MPDSRGVFTTTRPFAWGLVIMGDADTQHIPPPDRANAIASSDAAVVVRVRHAQDVADPDDDEFLVVVDCRSGSTDRDGLSFDGDILISSGRLSIGDADHEDTLIVTPGRWRLKIDTDPVEHPERVTVWFSPADGDSFIG